MGPLASTGLLCLVLSWNEAFWSLNLSSAKAGTLAVLIASYSSPEGLFWAKLSAASLLAIAPIVVVGWFSQKQLVQGMTFGAEKRPTPGEPSACAKRGRPQRTGKAGCAAAARSKPRLVNWHEQKRGNPPCPICNSRLSRSAMVKCASSRVST
jgi:hypothetical protein